MSGDLRSDPDDQERARPVAVIAGDARLRDAACLALRDLGADPVPFGDDASLLGAVVGQLGGLSRILIEASPHGLDPELLDALAEASPQAVLTVLPKQIQADTIGALLRDPAPAAGRNPVVLRPGGLMLRYQPILSLRDGRMEMVEALARWASEPVALTPYHFIPAMERMGLGQALASSVTRMATRDIARLPWPLKVSVNLAVAEFEKRDVAAWLARESRQARMPAERLCIELTETSPIVDEARLRRALWRLREAGHEVVLDDFVLDDPRRALLSLPFSGVKLDRSFTRMVMRSSRARAQVRSIAARGLCVTAEGVACAAELRLLRALGATRVQGFWLARPMPVQALRAWTRQRLVQPRKTRA